MCLSWHRNMPRLRDDCHHMSHPATWLRPTDLPNAKLCAIWPPTMHPGRESVGTFAGGT
jgi:hypothetical protein